MIRNEKSHAIGLAAFLLLSCLSTWCVAASLRVFELNVSPGAVGTRLFTASVVYTLTMGWPPVAAVWIVRRWLEPAGGIELGIVRARRGMSLAGAFAALALSAAATLVSVLATAWCSDVSVPLLRATEPELTALTPSVATAFVVMVAFMATTMLVWMQSFAEEVGWRGYCLYRAAQRFGVPIGLVVQGALWGLWYTPVWVFAHYGASDWRILLGRGLCFFLTCLFVGILFGGIRLFCRSLFPGAVANATLTFAGGLPYIMVGSDVDVRAAIYEPAGWSVLLLTLIAFATSKFGRQLLSMSGPDDPLGVQARVVDRGSGGREHPPDTRRLH